MAHRAFAGSRCTSADERQCTVCGSVQVLRSDWLTQVVPQGWKTKLTPHGHSEWPTDIGPLQSPPLYGQPPEMHCSAFYCLTSMVLLLLLALSAFGQRTRIHVGAPRCGAGGSVRRTAASRQRAPPPHCSFGRRTPATICGHSVPGEENVS